MNPRKLNPKTDFIATRTRLFRVRGAWSTPCRCSKHLWRPSWASGLPSAAAAAPCRPLEAPEVAHGPRPTHFLLGVGSISILFSHRSFQKPAISPGFLVVFKKDPWKAWGSYPRCRLATKCRNYIFTTKIVFPMIYKVQEPKRPKRHRCPKGASLPSSLAALQTCYSSKQLSSNPLQLELGRLQCGIS